MYATRSISPSSSSPSSSPPFIADSSPSTSPFHQSTTVNEDPPPLTIPPPIIHPFAASHKARKDQETHDKNSKRISDSSMPVDSNVLSRLKRAKLDSEVALARLASSSYDHEQAVWDAAIANVVDKGYGTIDLSDRNLTRIPAQISELSHFVAIPETSERNLASSVSLATQAPTRDAFRAFRRATTVPANIFSSRPALFERTRSIIDRSVGFLREDLQLFLSGNRISVVPPQLFLLDRLTVLSLRANNLTAVPPAIAKLIKLRELHLSNNRLTYLPSEMLSMTLTCLSVFPNPFLEEKDMETRFAFFRPRKVAGQKDEMRGGIVSHTRILTPCARIPEMTELCLRVLVSPSPFSPVPNLTHHYGPSLLPDGISAPLGALLNACVPGSVAEPPLAPTPTPITQGEDTVAGVGVCPSPRHESGGWFVRHAEERFSWEGVIGGFKVGGMVPVRWRGCQVGCLDFMDGMGEDGVKAQETEPTEEAVTLVNLGEGGLGDEWGD